MIKYMIRPYYKEDQPMSVDDESQGATPPLCIVPVDVSNGEAGKSSSQDPITRSRGELLRMVGVTGEPSNLTRREGA